MKAKSRKEARAVRHLRIRRKIRGTAERPRLAIAISNRQMYAQFIDDVRGVTLGAASTLGMNAKCNVETAGKLGQILLQKAQELGIKRIVVDRGGHKFHGRVRAIVEPLKQAGLLSADKEDVA